MFSFFRTEQPLLDNKPLYNDTSIAKSDDKLLDSFKVSTSKYEIVGKLFEGITRSGDIEYITMELFDKNASKRYKVIIKEFEDVGSHKYEIVDHYNTFKMALQKSNKGYNSEIKKINLNGEDCYDVYVDLTLGSGKTKVTYYDFRITMVYVDDKKIKYKSAAKNDSKSSA